DVDVPFLHVRLVEAVLNAFELRLPGERSALHGVRLREVDDERARSDEAAAVEVGGNADGRVLHERRADQNVVIEDACAAANGGSAVALDIPYESDARRNGLA